MGAPQRNYEGEALDFCNAAGMVAKVSEANEGQVADLGKAISDLRREIDAVRKAEGEEHRQALTKIQDTYNPILKSLDNALDHLKRRVADWKLEQIRAAEAEKKRIAAEEAERRRAAKEAEAAGQAPPEEPAIKEVAPPAPSNVARGSFGKTVGRKTWKAELVDIKLLCQAIIDDKVPAELVAFQAQKAVSLARGGIKFDPEEVGIRAWQQEDQSFS